MAEPVTVDSLDPHTNTHAITLCVSFIHTMSILLAYVHTHTQSQKHGVCNHASILALTHAYIHNYTNSFSD